MTQIKEDKKNESISKQQGKGPLMNDTRDHWAHTWLGGRGSRHILMSLFTLNKFQIYFTEMHVSLQAPLKDTSTKEPQKFPQKSQCRPKHDAKF